MPVLHLTFDDGPHPTFTPAILDVLAKHGALATFFQEGADVERYPEITQQAHAAGHVIANHAWSHPNLSQVDDATLEHELSATSELIENTLGCRPTLFRPPYGSPFHGQPGHPRGTAIKRQAADLGMKTVIWDIQVDDWNKPGVQQMVDGVVSKAADGRVVLLHDAECANEAANVEAVDMVITFLSQKGYSFEPIADPYDGSALV